MKAVRSIKALIFILLSSSILASFYTRDTDRDAVLLKMTDLALRYNHYQPKELNDSFSQDLYDRYIERLDHFKIYFTQADLNTLSPYRDELDDQIKNGDLAFFKKSIQIFKRELTYTHAFTREILSKPFDLTRDETVQTNCEQMSPAIGARSLRDLWRKRLKQSVVSYVAERQKAEADKRKEAPDYPVKSVADLERAGREKTVKDYDRLYERFDEKDDRYWMSVFLNAFAAGFDPHTDYLDPRAKAVFDINLSGQFEGIGAVLQERDGYIAVDRIIPGSPSYRQGDLEANDKIIKVAQGDGEPVNVVGMNIDDVIELIKGKTGTTVTLTVKKANGVQRLIPIVRGVVQLLETFAKSAVIERNGEKYGLIDLPSFYFDINGSDSRNSADDVRAELESLKADAVAGIVIDLRHNGGGALASAVEMAGLFITKGPVVQVREKSGRISVLRDRNADVAYGGPLVVLVDALSASASEILAAALQDYKRALIVGGQQTFGKGTVQNILNLDRYASPRLNDLKPLGYLKLTTSKFYRIDGGATQCKGVIPDIQLPDPYTYLKVGEKYQDNAMPWDHIMPLDYRAQGPHIDLNAVGSQSHKRVAANPFFTLADADARWLKEIADTDNTVYLNLNTFKKNRDSLAVKAKAFEALKHYDNKMRFVSTSREVEKIKVDTVLAANREAWHKKLKSDPYIEESVNILRDLSAYKWLDEKLTVTR